MKFCYDKLETLAQQTVKIS